MSREQIIQMALTKPIPSAPGYFIDSVGNVYNKRGKRMTQQITKKGYCRVHLQISGETKSKSIHSIVAEVFIGERPFGMQIRHLDGNKLNNNSGNLLYGTASENEADKLFHGTKPTGQKNGANTFPEKRPRGSSHGKSRLSEEEVAIIKRELKTCKRGVGVKLAKQFGVSTATISSIKSGGVWNHV